ncbi:MAG: CBS domain-containing protein [Deltaproteobacteria bacterium]|nr:CBS domain-containing protein [Deltaproteobacteria bacterium]
MLVADVMTKDVVTITGDVSLAEAKRIMTQHRLKRLPVVEGDRLLGVVTDHRLDHVSPGKAKSLTVWEVGYLLENTPVSKIMQKQVVTAAPDMTVEQALAIAQNNRVGSLVVVDDDRRVLGIVTTNDFFYNIANHVLGIGAPGVRIQVKGAGEAPELAEVLSVVSKKKHRLLAVHVLPETNGGPKDVVLHMDAKKADPLIKALDKAGYQATTRQR